MDFDFTEEQKMLKSNARAFLEAEIAPMVDERERMRTSFTKEEVLSLIKRLKPLGYYVGRLPDEYGGLNLSYKSDGILLEELARIWCGLAGTVMSAGGHVGQMVLRGNEEQKKRFLPRLLEPEMICNGAVSEPPDVGSAAPAQRQTTAVLDGDAYVINGTKTWIMNGTIAGVTRVMVKIGAVGDQRSVGEILVEREVSPHRVREIHKLGWRACPLAELSFVNCRVPKENWLEPVLGSTQRQDANLYLDAGCTKHAIVSVGIAQAAIDASLKYVRERKQFGRPIGGFQLVQEMLVDMVTETEAARLLAYRALDLLDKREEGRWQSNMAKAFASEMGIRVTSKAIQIHGAVGVVAEHPIERYFRDARLVTISEGTTEIRKLVVGRELIGISAIS